MDANRAIADINSMDPRAESLIEQLRLAPHPEGGFYRELHRSKSLIMPIDGRSSRSAITTIYFLLPAGTVSRWHKVSSDEVWHYLEGAPLELLVADPGFEEVNRCILGPLREGHEPECVVDPHHWQAARTQGAYTLVACVVGPGFEFADFAMLRHHSNELALLHQRQAALADLA